MGERNPCVDAALNELERQGLKGVVEERGKHLAVVWEYPNGRSHFVITSRTASDHRAALNCRGEVRRILREDHYEPPSPKVVLLQKAFSLPKPVDPLPTQVKRLETDIEGLIDIVAELTAQVEEQKGRLNNVRVTTTLSFDAPQVVAAVAPQEKKPRKGSLRSGILYFLNDERWHDRQSIATGVATDVKLVSAALSNLKGEGAVENGQRGMWRKKPQMAAVAQAV